MEQKVDLFLDSGAYSAYSKGAQIDIQEYIKFVKEYDDVITVYANLDVIGSPEGTWENQMTMEAAGCHPIPVYHYKEDIKWLKRYLSRGYDYMALGGLVTSDRAQMYNWMDRVFADYLTDKDGMPIIKVHGFGLTSLKLMLRYPWWSVDSTSWVMTGRMGSIYVPRYLGGKWVYDKDSWKIAVSSKSPANKEAGAHINTLPPGQRNILLHYIHDKGFKIGVSSFRKVPQTHILAENEKWAEKKPLDSSMKREVETIEEEGLCNKYQLRDAINIMYYTDLEASIQPWPWAFKEQGKGRLF